jgi:hypothetical protein
MVKFSLSCPYAAQQELPESCLRCCRAACLLSQNNFVSVGDTADEHVQVLRNKQNS